MRGSILLAALLLAPAALPLCGCGSTAELPPLPPSHPASIEAPPGYLPPASPVLSLGYVTPAPEGSAVPMDHMGHMGHEMPAAPAASPEPHARHIPSAAPHSGHEGHAPGGAQGQPTP